MPAPVSSFLPTIPPRWRQRSARCVARHRLYARTWAKEGGNISSRILPREGLSPNTRRYCSAMDYKSLYYPESRFGGFTGVDGTLAFYIRVNSLIDSSSVVLDVGCGRG